jgi:hypothetical protein
VIGASHARCDGDDADLPFVRLEQQPSTGQPLRLGGVAHTGPSLGQSARGVPSGESETFEAVDVVSGGHRGEVMCAGYPAGRKAVF